MSKIPCTIAILTKDNEATIGQAIESANAFDECLICDGGSSDRTHDIARASLARIIDQDSRFKDATGRISDFSGVHNQMLEASTHDWHFYLDSDELMTPELVEEIRSIVSANKPGAWWVNRKYSLEGETVMCAATYPTRQMRFFHKSAVTGFIKPIHERINPKPDASIGTTRNFMLVPVSPDPKVWREKWQHYIALEVARRGTISFWDWVRVCMENAKVSLLYGFRLVRNAFFCGGARMPFALEWERHVYHWNLCKALWKGRS